MEQLVGITKAILSSSFHFAGADLTVGDLIVVGIVLVASYGLSRVVRRVLDRRIPAHPHLTRNARFLILRFASALVLVAGVVISLNILQIRLTGLAVTFGFLSVGIGFGLQNITSNFVSGVILLFERPVRVGDLITVGDTVGVVEAIGIRATLIRTPDNVEMIIPNSQFIAQAVTNWTYRDKSVRVHVPVGVSYGSDTALVKQLLIQVAVLHPEVLTEPEPTVLFLAFGESSLDFDLRAWVPDPEERRRIVSDLNFAIDAAFRDHGVVIPFPQRDVHLDPG